MGNFSERHHWAIAAVILLCFGGAVFLFGGGKGDRGSVPSQSAMTVEARAQCRGAVKDKLKAPATAKFSDESVTGSDPDSVWFVSGAVDSQNSFGALIRSSFECSVTFKSGEASTVMVTSLS